MNSNGTKLEQVVHTHQKSCLSGWPREFGELDPSPRSHLPTSATVRISVHTALKCCTEPIRYMTLHFRDRRGEASLRYRNRAEIFVFANKRESCKLICGPSRQETRSHVEVF